jgi:alpha-glucosidase
MKKCFAYSVCICLLPALLLAQKRKTYELKSPDGNISVKVEVGNKLQWSVQHKGQQIIAPSAISLQLDNAELGDSAAIISASVKKINVIINASNYKKTIIPDQYNELTLNCKGDYGVIFRAYNEAVAYRFFIKNNGDVIVKNEEANFNFTEDYKSFIPTLASFLIESGRFEDALPILQKAIGLAPLAAEKALLLKKWKFCMAKMNLNEG